jgi:glucose/arabinose dehydrogenase
MMTYRLQFAAVTIPYLSTNFVQMRHFSSIIAIFCFFSTLQAQPVVELEPYASGFTYPLHITHAGDDRMFVVQRQGKIKIIDGSGTVLAEPFLDITDRIESGYEERGLLGLAFHPDYVSNGYFFVSYTDLDGNSVISRFSVTADPNIADEDSEFLIYDAVQPYSNHNGGCIHFGPDGYLYIALGDGGSGGDPGDRAQNPENKLGKIHRLDVDGGEPYAIPADNPFVGAADTLETIWSIGVRNPWRFTFDRETGDIWMADVGQNLYEELNFEAAGDGGHNYGWRCYEGNHTFSLAGCEDESFYTFPIYEYNHSFGTGGYSVTGGYRYRGTDFPGMVGYYFMADFVSGNWWWVRQAVGGEWEVEFLDEIEDDIAGFGEDVYGELYCADLYSGIIYRVTDACGDFNVTAEVDSFYCEAAPGSIDLTVTGGTEPYDILWSTGSSDEDIIGADSGIYSVVVFDNGECSRELMVDVPVGSVPVPVITFDGTILSTVGGIDWQWYLDGVAIPAAGLSTFTPTEEGFYTVEITWENGCTAWSDSLEVLLNNIYDLQAAGIVVSPNPIQDWINIDLSQEVVMEQWLLTDVYGQVIAGENNLHLNENIQIPVQDLPAGMYTLTCISQAGRISVELVKLSN